jgi:hypothetical protein
MYWTTTQHKRVTVSSVSKCSKSVLLDCTRFSPKVYTIYLSTTGNNYDWHVQVIPKIHMVWRSSYRMFSPFPKCQSLNDKFNLGTKNKEIVFSNHDKFKKKIEYKQSIKLYFFPNNTASKMLTWTTGILL